jgi:membrane protease YdiL (CAAX protease family)
MVVWLAIAVEGGLLGLACLAGSLLGHWPLERFRFEPWGLLWGVLATLPMLAGFFAAVRWPVGPLGKIKQFSDEVIRPLMGSCSLVDLVGISVLAGLGEELFFRGVMQDWVAGLGAPLWVAILAAALLFGLLHAVTPTYAVLAVGVGVYLGWLYVLSGNLLAAVVAHALYDFVALVYLTRGPGSDAPAPADGEGPADATGPP